MFKWIKGFVTGVGIMVTICFGAYAYIMQENCETMKKRNKNLKHVIDRLREEEQEWQQV